MRYEGSVYRPPSEARSYILQCTIGCSHNRCTFCGMYKDKKYRVRDIQEIKADIRLAQQYYGDLEKIFLADGDALALDTPSLLDILQDVYATFSSLRHVGIYAGPDTILEKSPEDLKALKDAGLTIAYMGIETGDDELLKEIRKGVNSDEMIQAGKKIRNAGIQLSVMIILGLAGRTPKAVEHAVKSAQLCNEINPDYIAALTLMLVPKTELYKKMKKGDFELPGPFEILEELKIIVENLNVQGTEFRSNHASNYLPIKGRLPEDKEKIIQSIDHIIKSNNRNYLRPDYLRAL